MSVTGPGGWEAAFREGLDAMRTKGLFRADADTHALALTVVATFQGGLLLSQTRRDARTARGCPRWRSRHDPRRRRGATD